MKLEEEEEEEEEEVKSGLMKWCCG